ncbi:MAG: HAMP domain-containing histidine kinase [Nocardioides sp.]|nr:HAMP domain-containing histidine kinase [Nocardioides sp.]
MRSRRRVPDDRPGGQRWRYRQSLASRVIALTTVVVVVAVAFVAVGAYITARVQLQSTLDSSLLDRAEQAGSTQALSLLTGLDNAPSVFGAGDVRVAFVTQPPPGGCTRGTCVISTDSGPRLALGRPELDVADGLRVNSIRTVTAANGVNYRVVAVPTTTATGERQALVLAQALTPQERVLSRLGSVMLVFGAAGVLAAAVAGWGVARNGLRPVRRLSLAAEEIARTEDLDPLPVEGTDEIARLAASFNQVLTALSASRDRQRQLVIDAGHELRTPLTSLRTNIELLTQAGDGDLAIPPVARRELLDDVGAQIEELTNLIGDLVELARDEPMGPVVGPVELHETLEAALVRVRRRAPGVTFDLDADPWFLLGEGHSIERALTNLLDNAAKWSPPEGTVRIQLRDGVLTVDDEGPGIADQDQPHVFERFYRSEESRAMPGSGLGLSIVAQVVERHAGTVVVGRAPGGGARLQMRLPGSATVDDVVPA